MDGDIVETHRLFSEELTLTELKVMCVFVCVGGGITHNM